MGAENNVEDTLESSSSVQPELDAPEGARAPERSTGWPESSQWEVVDLGGTETSMLGLCVTHQEVTEAGTVAQLAGLAFTSRDELPCGWPFVPGPRLLPMTLA